MIKDGASRYLRQRAPSWQRLKQVDTIEARIRAVDARGLVVEDADGRAFRLASGIGDRLRRELARDPDDFLGRLVEVAFNQRTGSGAPRHARLLRLREDRSSL